MKRIATWLLATVGGVVLLFGYRTSTQAVGPSTAPAADGAQQASSAPALGSEAAPQASTAPDGSPDTPSPRPSSPAAPPDTAASPGTSGTSSGGALADGTYTGAAVNTRFGPVQVQITVQGGAITAATAVDYPAESGRDQMINSYAIPLLEQESVGASSAQQLDMVTGATFTSDGYAGSLQDAIDQAR